MPLNHLFHSINQSFSMSPIDVLGFSVIDFRSHTFHAVQFDKNEGSRPLSEGPYFDLASLTKPLTNSLSYFLRPDLFDEKMLLCLNHRGGLPAWGLLPRNAWREQILGYPVTPSSTLYSDFSALRVLLELEQKKVSLKELCSSVWDKELCYWTDLPGDSETLQCGFIQGEPNRGYVHDPNAFNLGVFCSHAGLFGTIGGLSRTLLSYQKKTSFIEKVKADLLTHRNRFSFGWDRVENPDDSLAGAGCGPLTFGHLGFTGTSIWIDPDRMLGHIILSNAVKFHWYQKKELNEIRKTLGALVWSGASTE